MKTNFFSNITHEFRTPLTLMLEPARRILAKTQDPEIIENARHVEANSHRLLALVNQLLDMAKFESGSMGLDLRQGDLGKPCARCFARFCRWPNNAASGSPSQIAELKFRRFCLIRARWNWC